ncbi:tyrosine-protein phosphatase [Glycomyces arizonensis]|uniref:tyrosine-protein phosphatase n=1 Tax=Glycomyces arizonensis TaxID=256035 RepID=UPI00041B2EE5|nr:tyrosine-protein phosphatase [Glycomyces arizonensis]
MSTLHLPDCLNARDLGGLPLGDAVAVRAGALLRSDNHDRLTPAGIDAVRKLGVTRILDLRYDWEAREFASPFADDPIYRNVPLIRESPTYDPTAPEDYRPELDESPDLIAAAFTALAEAPAGPVLVHCHAGRDRTGVLTAFALAVAGASVEAIAAEYALTEGADPATMLAVLDHLDRHWEGATGYLMKAGVQEHHLRAVADRLTERRSEQA